MNNKSLERRDFIKMLILAGGGAAAATLPSTRPAVAASIIKRTPQERWAELGMGSDLFVVTGVPKAVAESSMPKTANESPAVALARKDVVHKNDILLGTEHWMAEPGIRTYTDLGVTVNDKGKLVQTPDQVAKDLSEIEANILWKTAEVQDTLTFNNYPVLIPDGGFLMLTGAGLEFAFPDGQSAADVTLGARPGHTWFAYIRNFERDNKLDTDPGVMLYADFLVSPGAVKSTKLAPGQFVSLDYVMQNVDAAQGKSKGPAISPGSNSDGAGAASIFCLDLPTGAWVVIRKDTPNAQWKQIKTNMQ